MGAIKRNGNRHGIDIGYKSKIPKEMKSIRNIIKSKTDKRIYSYQCLSNKLRCIFISDSETEKSAASMDVHIGSLFDPIERAGLAHFCEHMLFLGSEKYPSESQYSQFIKENGGRKNAYTSAHDTNYYFDIGNPSFKECLDRFSCFFKCPLMDEGSVAREVMAVDSENQKNLQIDAWREQQLFKSQANSESVFSKFSTGNAQTLNVESVRDELLEFHKKYYSANLMTLVLLGREDLGTLEAWGQEFFGDIPNMDVQLPDITTPPAYTYPENLGFLYKIVPVKNKNVLKFKWILPYTERMYKSKPLQYISHILGHEGQNSLTSYLKDEGLCNELLTSDGHQDTEFDVLNLIIELTDEGLKRWREVPEIVFSYIKMLKVMAPQEYFFRELQQMSDIAFEYKNVDAPMSSVLSLSRQLHLIPEEDYQNLLTAKYLLKEYDEVYIKELISLLGIDNLNIYFLSQDFEGKTTEEEKWYGTKFSKEKFDEDLRWKMLESNDSKSSKIRGVVPDMPPPNILLPKAIDLLPKKEDLPLYPELIHSEVGLDIWYKQDHKFNVPKAFGYCKIKTSDCHYGVDPKSEIYAILLKKMFFEDIREFMYMAELARVTCRLSVFTDYISFTFSGFNESLPLLVKEYFQKFRAFNPVDSERYKDLFNEKYEQMKKNTHNELLQSPYQMAFSELSVYMGSQGLSPKKKLDLLNSINYEEFCEWNKNFLVNCNFECLLNGNISSSEAKEIMESIPKYLGSTPTPSYLLPQKRVMKVPKDKEIVSIQSNINSSESNSCLLSYFQGGEYKKEKLEDLMSYLVLFEYLGEPAFEILRTQEQLGYVVFCLPVISQQVLGGMILIQSAKGSPEFLYERIANFIHIIGKEIEKLEDEVFKKYINAVGVKYRQPVLTLGAESSHFWVELEQGTYMFDAREQKLLALEKVTKEGVVNIFKRLFIEEVRRFDYECLAKEHELEQKEIFDRNKGIVAGLGRGRVVVQNEDIFRRICEMYPDFALLNKIMGNNI